MKIDILNIPPSNRLEKLKGDLKNYWSISNQWRINFEWNDGDVYNIQMFKYFSKNLK